MKAGVAISGTVLSRVRPTGARGDGRGWIPPRDGAVPASDDGQGRQVLLQPVRRSGPAGAGAAGTGSGPCLGSAPSCREGEEIPEQVIRLSRRRAVEGRVVDAMGKPIGGAFVWSSRDVYRGLIEWQAETDANGQFVWYEAPIAAKLYLDIFKPFFLRSSGTVDRPENGEITITLPGRR